MPGDEQQVAVMAFLDAQPQVVAMAVADRAWVLEVSQEVTVEVLAVPVLVAKLAGHASQGKEKEVCHLPNQELQQLRDPRHRLSSIPQEEGACSTLLVPGGDTISCYKS